MDKIKEKNKIKKNFFSIYGPAIKIARPKNKDKNNGTNKSANGISGLYISSCVKDIEIQ